MNKKACLTLIALLFALIAFPQYGRINADSIRHTLKPGESRCVIETFVGDKVTSQKIVEQKTDSGKADERYIVRFMANPLMSNRLKSTTNTSNLELEHEQFRKDFSELLSKSGVNQLKSTSSLIHHEFKRLINGVSVTLTSNLAAEVKKLNYVLKVEKDELVGINDEGSNEAIEAPRVWNELGYTGKGVVIAIIDTGVDTTHECFTGKKFVKGYDFVNDDNDPFDDHFHGTHVAGIAAANSGKIKGVAPDAKIMPVKVLSKDGSGYDSWIIAGIEFALDPDNNPNTNDGAQVLSLSIGGSGNPDDAMSEAIDNAVLKGAVCVVAAGNAGSNNYTIQSPGCARKALTVGSCNNSGLTSYFSSRGPCQLTQAVKPEVSAPGEAIYSSIPGSNYESYSGTSMATPHVAGLAALIKQKNPTWEPEQIKSVIIQSAQKKSGKVLEEGFGMVNAYQALQNEILMDPYVLDLGVIDDKNGSVVVSKEIRITNTSSEVKEITLTTGKTEDGLSVSLSTDSIHLVPGETETLTISCTLAPALITSVDLIPLIASEVMASDRKNVISLPIVYFFGKTIKFSFDRIPDYCGIFSSDWLSTVNFPVNATEQTLVVGKNKTDLVVSFDGFSRYVLKENIELSDGELKINMKDANHQLIIKPDGPEGGRLNVFNERENFKKKNGELYSGFRLLRIYGFTVGDYDFPDIKKYFSDVSKDYAYESSCTAYPMFNKNINQIIKIPIGLLQGINESKEVHIYSSDYKKLRINLDLKNIHDSLYYTTDYNDDAFVTYDNILKDKNRISLKSTFEFYLLPAPTEDFRLSNGTRFSFWTKLPETYPFDRPVLATDYYYLNRQGDFSFNQNCYAAKLPILDKVQVLTKNLMSSSIFWLTDHLHVSDPLSMSGKYEEIYQNPVVLTIKDSIRSNSIDTLSSGFTYQYDYKDIVRDVSMNDSVIISTSYPFCDSITTKASFMLKKDTENPIYTDFPRQVVLNGTTVDNKYFLPDEKNNISFTATFLPKLWIRKERTSSWKELAVEMKWDTISWRYEFTSAPMSGNDKGYYDLRMSGGYIDQTKSISEWRPAFYICDGTQADSLYLVQLYQSTFGEKWINHTGWLKEKLGNWYGITMENGRVIKINLADNNLTGNLPDTTIKLDRLFSLDVSGNRLEFIPDLSGIPELKELNVQKNKLDFSSIVPNKSIASFNFLSQDSLFVDCKNNLIVNAGLVLRINSNYKGNQFKWFKDDQLITESDTSFYSAVANQISDGGIYYGQVHNKDIPDFYIPTKKVRIKIQEKVFETLEDQSIESLTRGISSTNWVDVDNDGDEDLFVANKDNGKSSLYINKMVETGQAIFEETRPSGLFADPLSICTSTWADYNNDGLEDLATFSDHGTSDHGNVTLHLFENRGNCKFNKKEIGVSINNTSWEALKGSCWVDLNHDNYLDLAMGYEEWTYSVGADRIGIKLMNNKGEFNSDMTNCEMYGGDILFADISKEKGTEMILSFGIFSIFKEDNNCLMDIQKTLFWKSIATTNSPSLGDFDNDGDLDIFSPINNSLTSSLENQNAYFENKSGTFIQRTDLSPVLKSVSSTSGSVCFDYDNDGDLDLAVSNASAGNELYKNLFMETGKLAFEPVPNDAFDNEIGNWIGISASDINLDGYLDLTTVSSSSVNFLINRNKGNNWLSVKCNGKMSNGSAIGAKVYAIATINGKRTSQYREIIAASGETSVTSKRLHFGLGNATQIDSLIIKWPSGITDVLTDLSVNKYMDITESLHQVPIANAGSNQKVNEGEMVTLDGSASSDPNGKILVYRWTSPKGILLSAFNTSKPTFIAPEVKSDTPFIFTLVVSDDINVSVARQVTITIKQVNKIPIAKAGPDQTITEGVTVKLNGSSSTDPDGNPLTFKWSAPAGIVLNAKNIASPTFFAPITGESVNYTFDLTVNDGLMDSRIDQVIIRVKNINKAPVANAGIDQTIEEGQMVTLDGNASFDPEQEGLYFNWKSPVGITLDNENSVRPKFIAPEVKADSILAFSLMVSDGKLNSDTTTVKVTVRNVFVLDISISETSSFKLFPNPTAGIVNIEVDLNSKRIYTVSVFNTTGSEVFHKEMIGEAKFQVDLSSLADGIYFLKVSNGDVQNISKIVIRKE